jgi:hypothetical protein
VDTGKKVEMNTIGYDFYTSQTTKLLKDFDRVVKQVKVEITLRYGIEITEIIVSKANEEFRQLLPELPYVGGKQPLTQFVVTTGWCLALHRAMEGYTTNTRESGELFFQLSKKYLEQVPGIARRILGTSIFTERYQRKLREHAKESQQQPLPRGYIFSHVAGDGVNFDFGVDYHRCATLNFLREQGGEEIAPYLCALDHLSSEMLGWGLTRTKTLAEGGDVCDFRFKKGGQTRISSTVLELK